MKLADWLTLITVGVPVIATAVVNIILAVRTSGKLASLSADVGEVHRVVNSSADKLAESNRQTVAALTSTIQAQQNPPAST